jgi:glycerophosphoryl diester phosphodiesterase
MSDLSWLIERPIAHRGYHDLNKTRWENTLSAFATAADKGFAIECDVHLSSDGEVVVFHDNELRRLCGIDGYIWQKSAIEMAALRIGGTKDYAPRLVELLDLVAGRVPLVIELKGIPGYDDGLVAKVAELLKTYPGKAAIMSFDHWLIRQFPIHAPGIPAGLTAWGSRPQDWERHFSMLGYDLSFVSYSASELPNPFSEFIRHRLGMKLITWTVREEPMVRHTFAHADQMTFEGFDPDAAAVA